MVNEKPQASSCLSTNKGLDEGAIVSIQKMLLEVRKKEIILLITEDLDEFMLSDRIG